MRRRFQAFIAALLVSLITIPVLHAAEVDPFYLQRLTAGKTAWDSGRYVDAVDELRIASFGFLDDLDLLSETLARLAAAQHEAGMQEEAIATVQRFVNIESFDSRFGNYELDPRIETILGMLLKSAIPNERLAEIPSLAKFHTSREGEIFALSGRARTRALEESAQRDPNNPRWYILLTRDAIQRRSTRDAQQWVERGLRVAPDHPELLEMQAEFQIRNNECLAASRTVVKVSPFPEDLAERVFLCLADQGNRDEALAILEKLEATGYSLSVAATRARDALRTPREPSVPRGPERTPVQPDPSPAPTEQPAEPPEPEPAAQEETEAPQPEAAEREIRVGPASLKTARELLDAGRVEAAKQMLIGLAGKDDSREAGVALLEAAVRTRDWTLARTQVGKLTPFRRSEPIALFYAAVTLYESGRYADAKRLFEAARPRLRDNELVLRYERLILGP